jgi:hypothetical protein
MRKIRGILADPDATAEEIAWAMSIGIIEALREYKRKGIPAVTWDRENRRIVTTPPEEIALPEVGYDWDGDPIPAERAEPGEPRDRDND